MNTRNLLVSILMLVCVLLSACTPAAPTRTPQRGLGAKEIGQIVSSTPSTVFPQKIHVSQDAIWYWFEECGCVMRFDPKSGKEVASIKVGDGKAGPYGNPKDMAIEGNVIWVTDAGHFAVVRINPATNQPAEQIPLEVTNAAGKTEQIQPFGLALDGKTLLVSDFDKNLVVRVDTETKKIIALIADIKNPEWTMWNVHRLCSSH
jgi:streptogramin lyase